MSALEGLGRSLNDAMKKLLRLAVVDEKAVKELVRDLQRALLQSDVNVNLVLQISQSVETRSLEEKLPPGISRREHVIKVLYEELTRFLGEDPSKIIVEPGKRHVIMLVGIQGTGKTTASVKLARFYQKRGMSPAIVCADTYRPGAFDQLRQLAERVNVPVYGEPNSNEVLKIVKRGMELFDQEKHDLIIIDTAGRHKDEDELMSEMKDLARNFAPDEIILAIDSSIGQAAMSQATAFNQTTTIGSILVTKLDGTAKGGGALSAVAATKAKINFIGTGEKIDDLEQFLPSSFVGRLLGMGDVKALVDKVREAEVVVPQKKARAFLEGKFTLKDMYDQMIAVRKMGPLKKLMGMVPGGMNIPDDAMETAEKRLDSWRVIIQSMTKEEVEDPKLVDSSRARRIARGSGRNEKEVKELISQYFMMKKMMKSMKRRGGALGRKLPFPVRT
ncbi:MAG TPA: signal recognition particle protein Srp54 [Candidatus Saccharimonadales bacterium]|nr:signal recognition particle protein Srp54 [Candidatus Saccharimonadales bacterium]